MACVNGQSSVVSAILDHDLFELARDTDRWVEFIRSAASAGHFHIVSLLLESDFLSIDDNQWCSKVIMCVYGKPLTEVMRIMLSLRPSLPRQQEFVVSFEHWNPRSRPNLLPLFSMFPVFEWERQIGLQDEILCLLRAVKFFKDEKEKDPELEYGWSFLTLVMEEIVVRQSGFLFALSQLFGREIPYRALEWHARRWHRTNPLPVVHVAWLNWLMGLIVKVKLQVMVAMVLILNVKNPTVCQLFGCLQ